MSLIPFFLSALTENSLRFDYKVEERKKRRRRRKGENNHHVNVYLLYKQKATFSLFFLQNNHLLFLSPWSDLYGYRYSIRVRASTSAISGGFQGIIRAAMINGIIPTKHERGTSILSEHVTLRSCYLQCQ